MSSLFVIWTSRWKIEIKRESCYLLNDSWERVARHFNGPIHFPKTVKYKRVFSLHFLTPLSTRAHRKSIRRIYVVGARVRNDAVWRETAAGWHKYLRFRHCGCRLGVKQRRNKAWEPGEKTAENRKRAIRPGEIEEETEDEAPCEKNQKNDLRPTVLSRTIIRRMSGRKEPREATRRFRRSRIDDRDWYHRLVHSVSATGDAISLFVVS